MIGFGESLFGINNSFGWRFSSAVVGTLAILMIGRIGRRLFGSTMLGCIAALLLAFDGEEFVHSRTGLLDIEWYHRGPVIARGETTERLYLLARKP